MPRIQRHFHTVQIHTDADVFDVRVRVEYVVTDELPELGMSYNSLGQPSEPREVDIIRIIALEPVEGFDGFAAGTDIGNLISQFDFDEIKSTLTGDSE